MADWEKELSPSIKDKLNKIGEMTQDEKLKIKELEKLDLLLRDFFKGNLDVHELWDRLKEFEKQDKQYLLRDAYAKLKGSFKWKGLPIKFEEKGKGILSIEFREEEEAETELVLDLNDGNFDKVVKEQPMLVVDCWAEWCAPCRMVAPIIDQLAEEYRGKITFAKLNVDHNRSIAARYQIMSIPTLLVFKNGQMVDQKVGAMPKQALAAELNKLLGQVSI